MEFVVMLSMCPDARTAEAIARRLVEERLAACGNVVPGATSVYRWKGKVHRDPEVLLILKTRASLAGECVRRIRALHPYELPEVVAVPIVRGLTGYLEWIRAETTRPPRTRGERTGGTPSARAADEHS